MYININVKSKNPVCTALSGFAVRAFHATFISKDADMGLTLEHLGESRYLDSGIYYGL